MAPRYAPPDPSLPKPWRALIDDSTGYVYFWNPETSVTQYQKPDPVPPPESGPPAADPLLPESNREMDPPQNHRRSEAGEEGSRIPHQSQDDSAGNGRVCVGYGADDDDDDEKGRVQLEPAREPVVSADVGSQASAEAYRGKHEITVAYGDAPHPFTTFDSAGFPPEILREVKSAGFSAPTPIQAQSWPIALKNRDIVAVAKTGSGKTLGYLIPGFIHLMRHKNDVKMGPRVLVLSPTRELATQIHDEAEKFGRSSRISSVCLYGGAPKGPQLRDLDRGAHVVIATPGRLNDILEMKRVYLHQVSYLVLDEADRMLDMGFEPQIRKIVNQIPKERQTLMFTATWPKEVRKIAADLLVKPVQVNIGNIDELVANKSITQHVEVISSMEKQRRLQQILRSQQPGSKIIIFCATKRMCDQLARVLDNHFGAAAIHGDKSQAERDSILSQFRSGSNPVLVATDVAARGLDIKDIRVVINYDFPTGIEDYVHRIGRTGRAGATGEAYTFFCSQDSKYASDLVKILEGASQCVPEELRDMVSRSGYGGGGYGGKSRRWSADSGSHDDYGGSKYGGSEGYSAPSKYGRSEGYSARSSWGSQDTCRPSWGSQDASHDHGGDNKSDDRPIWSHEKAMAAGGSCFSSRTSNVQGGGWGSSDFRSRSRSPVRNGNY